MGHFAYRKRRINDRDDERDTHDLLHYVLVWEVRSRCKDPSCSILLKRDSELRRFQFEKSNASLSCLVCKGSHKSRITGLPVRKKNTKSSGNPCNPSK